MTLDDVIQLHDVIVVDTEFRQERDAGTLPHPWCVCWMSLRDRVPHRLWLEDDAPPFYDPDNDILCAFYAPAEVSTFLQCGWPKPKMVIDLFAEFRCRTNGLFGGRSLLDAMGYFGLPAMAAEHKALWRERLIHTEPPFPLEWRQGAMDYCALDVDMTIRLLFAMAPEIDWHTALLRGSYMACLAEIERRGIPVDGGLYHWLRDHWEDAKRRMIESCGIDAFEGTSFSHKKFAQVLHDMRIHSWEQTEAGFLVTQGRYFERMAFEYPALRPLLSVKRTLDTFNQFKLALGPGGRNRAPWWPFSSVTARNQPKAGNILGNHSRWVRGLVRPEPGRAVIEIDYAQQEFGIAAALSEDQAMLQSYRSFDPYIAIAILAGDAPEGATKQTHLEIRRRYKVVTLATQFGSTFVGIARQLQVAPAEAALLLRKYNHAFRVFRAWQEQYRNNADYTGRIVLPCGWRVRRTDAMKWRTLDNFPMQGTGSEMLRFAVVRLSDAGLSVIGMIHDSLVFETDLSDAEDVAARAANILSDVSEDVLAGRLRLRTDTRIIRPGERMLCPEALPMWRTVTDPYFATQHHQPLVVGPLVAGGGDHQWLAEYHHQPLAEWSVPLSFSGVRLNGLSNSKGDH